MSRRAIIIGTIVGFCFIVVIFRLSDLMLLQHAKLKNYAMTQQTFSKEAMAGRGNIYDRKGRELALNVETDSVFCNPSKIKSPESAAMMLASASDIDSAVLMKIINSGKGFSWIKRKLDPEISDRIKALNLEHVGFKPELKRMYPKGPLLSHVIGAVGVDNQPLEGIEKRYDETLSKSGGGAVVVERDADGNRLSSGEASESRGNSLVLTVDEWLQTIVEEELDTAMLQWRSVSAVVIMMDPYTGEILAMSSRPTYDPNHQSSFPTENKKNRAIMDRYEPGSTYKLVTAACALEKGVVTLQTRINCGMGQVKVGKWVIKDVHKYGVMSFKEVLQKSSNVGTINVGLKLGFNNLYDMSRRFGFGQLTGIDLPNEAEGWVKKSDKSDASTATLSIGYGVAVTPIQVLRAYSTVANGGLLVTPYVVKEIRTPDGALISKAQPKPGTRVISEKTASSLKDILMSVTDKGGTGTDASIDGNAVAGKTGTARLKGSNGKAYSSDRYASSFVGFVPADDPKIAMIVVVYEPKGQIYGGKVAAPVFKSIAERTLSYLNVPRDDMKEKNIFIVKASGTVVK